MKDEHTMPTNPKNTTQTPSGGAPSGDGFFDKESAVPPAEARIPEPPAAQAPGAEPPPRNALVTVDGKTPPVAGVSAPDIPPASPLDDDKKTPEQWADELGHVDAPSNVSDDDEGKVAKTKRRRSIREAKGYIFAAVKRHTGWGKQLPIDVRLTREEYEEAVAETMGTTLGQPGGEPRTLKWRHDVVAANAKTEAEKAGGER